MDFELGLFGLILTIPFGYFFIETVNFIAMYYFSYVRHGTGLLTLNIIIDVFRVCFVMTAPIFFWNEIFVYYANNLNKNFALDVLLSCVYFLAIVQWVLFSFKLRNENKLMAENEILSMPEYQELVQELKTLTDVEELYRKYGECVRTYPHIAGAFKRIYNQRQIELNHS